MNILIILTLFCPNFINPTSKFLKLSKENHPTIFKDKEISPLLYGAKGDGIADDTRPLQMALNAAKIYKKKINLFNLKYKTTAPLIIRLSANEELNIIGKGAILDISTNGLVINSLDTLVDNAGTLLISGIKFQAPRFKSQYNSLSIVNGILVNRINKIIITKCFFDNIYGNGIALMGYCESGLIKKNTFTSVHGFLELKRDNLIDSYGDAILVQDHCENLEISSNKISLKKGKKGRCGISIDYYSSNIDIYNNDITGYDRCIHIESSNCISAYGNRTYESNCGIIVSSSTKINISSNVIDGQNPLNTPFISHPGLLFSYNSNQCYFSKNVIKGWKKQEAPTYSIKLWGNNIIFKENINLGGPVYAYGVQSGLSISNNKFYNSAIDFSLNKKILLNKNNFISSQLLLNSTEDCQVSSNNFLPLPDSLFSEKVQVYFVKKLSFSNNKIYSANNFLIDNFNVHSLSTTGNILYKRKTEDASKILRLPAFNSKKKSNPDLLEDLTSRKKIEI